MDNSRENKIAKYAISELLKTNKFCMTCAAPLIEKTVDGEQRAACSNESCDFVFWNNPVPVVATLVEHVDEQGASQGFILAHNVQWPEGMYSVIAGFLEAVDESAALSAKRETKEELNLNAQRIHYIGHYSSARANQIIIAFHVQATGEVKLNYELDDYKRIPFERLKGWETETGQAVGDFIVQRNEGLLKFENC